VCVLMKRICFLFLTNWFITVVAFCIVGRFATVPVSTEFREIRLATDTKKKELWLVIFVVSFVCCLCVVVVR